VDPGPDTFKRIRKKSFQIRATPDPKMNLKQNCSEKLVKYDNVSTNLNLKNRNSFFEKNPPKSFCRMMQPNTLTRQKYKIMFKIFEKKNSCRIRNYLKSWIRIRKKSYRIHKLLLAVGKKIPMKTHFVDTCCKTEIQKL
jgi:hypothetical protein